MKNQDLEIQTKLLNYYEMVIEKVKGMEGEYDIMYLLNKKYMEHGLCFCSKNKFNKDISKSNWVILNKSLSSDYWGKTPVYAFYKNPNSTNTKPEILEALQFKADKLKEIINSNN